MSDPTSTALDEADSIHDDDPPRAAALLRSIDAQALAAEKRPGYAFLVNHVLGEKLGAWAEAASRQSALLRAAGDAASPVLWRQAAVAAELAGDAAAADAAVAGLASAASVGDAQARELVRLAAAGFAVPLAAAQAAGERVNAALAALDAAHWQVPGALDVAAAAACNNIAAALSEKPLDELRNPALRQALMQAARRSQALWARAGQWVNDERAWYGVAVAAGAAGDANEQHGAAAAGLALLDRHDTANEQSVDRAFLELERSHALQRLHRADEAAAARALADTIAAGFGDASLGRWYHDRTERIAALLAS